MGMSNGHVTYYSCDEAEVTRHDVIKVVSDENSANVKFDFV